LELRGGRWLMGSDLQPHTAGGRAVFPLGTITRGRNYSAKNMFVTCRFRS
jgi:hypothetical protein